MERVEQRTNSEMKEKKHFSDEFGSVLLAPSKISQSVIEEIRRQAKRVEASETIKNKKH